MGVIKAFTILLLLLASVSAFPQIQETNFQQEYLNGKQFFREGRYGLAQDTFEKVIPESDGNNFSAYASYYYALCSHRQGYSIQSRDMLLQIKSRYPEWEQMGEVNYWLSLINFELQNTEKALEYSLNIENKEEVLQMQRYFLQQINGLDTLMNLLNMFPGSYAVAEQAAYLITKQNFLDRDLALLDSLVNQFDLPFLNKEELDDMGPKDRYTVSLLFPFLSSELKPDLSPRINQFVLDLYQGIKLASDTLNQMGSIIEFNLFDTQRDTSVVKSFFTDNRLIESDLVIGPLYNPEFFSEFSYINQISMVHPYLKDGKLIESNPYFMLYSSIPDDVGARAANLVLSDTTIKTGIVFYGESERDSLMANRFLELVDSSHFEVITKQKISIGEEREALRVLTSGMVVNKLTAEEMEMAQDSIDLIYVASNNSGGSVYANILTGVEARGDTIPVLGSRNWIEDNVVSKDLLERLDVTMTAYDFIHFTDSSYIRFSDEYLKKYGRLPTKFSAIGYDMMMFFGQSLQKYGKYFQIGLRGEGFIPGTISYGFDYTEKNSNGVIPVIRWQDGTVILVEKLREEIMVEESEGESKEKEK